MGIPEINIKFKEETKKLATKAERGIVAILLKDSTEVGLHTIKNIDDIPVGLSETNKGLINDVLLGNTQERREGSTLTEITYRPNKVIAYVINTSGGTTDEALKVMESEIFNIICYPDAQAEDDTKILDFTKKMNNLGSAVMCVIAPTPPSDYENAINWATDKVKRGGTTISKKKYCGRIAGLIAGTPYTQSITYAKLLDLTEIPVQTKEEADNSINGGNLIAIQKAGAIRIARGVTSLTTTDRQTKGESFKKIKLQLTKNYINNTIMKVISDFYLGKVSNSYNNKILLNNEISAFLDEISKEELIEANHTVDINVEKQKAYLKSKGMDVSAMDENEIKRANTGSHVFIKIHAVDIDAMEDFDIEISR